VERLIDKLAVKDHDWFVMAKSFGVSDDMARDLVQDMYLRIHKYVDNPERIFEDDGKVNTYYIYVTMRNLYCTRYVKQKTFVELSDNIAVEYDSTDFAKENALLDITTRINNRVKEWYWYDKKLWDIHFHQQLSMRDIAKATKISLSSIFNTLKNCKTKIREEFSEDIEDYKNQDYDRI